ncbi:MAG: HAD family phosphatase [Erysipelotrichaceae bacterium]
MINTVIFDMDGVLIDSEVIYLNSLKKYLNSINIITEIEELIFVLGMSMKDISRGLIEKFGIKDISIEKLISGQNEFFDEEIHSTKLECMEGLIPFLTFLKENKCKTVLASSSDIVWITQVLSELSITQYFDLLIDGKQVKKSKPNPDIFNLAVEKIQCKKNECIVIEDSYNGINAAINAGIFVVGFKGSKIVQNTAKANTEVFSFESIKSIVRPQ